MIALEVFLLILIVNTQVESSSEFIVDYFVLKKISSVVGFTCNSLEDDFSLVKQFTKNGIGTAVQKLNKNYKVDIISTSNWKLGIFIDSQCHDTQNIELLFSKATDLRLYDFLNYWLVLSSDLNHTLSLIDDTAFGISTDFVIAVSSNSFTGDNYNLYDVYNIWKDRGASLNISYLGWWNKDRHFYLDSSFDSSKYAKRADLLGLTMKMTYYSCKYKPSNMALEDYYKMYSIVPRDNISKFGFNLILHLSEMYNFKSEHTVVTKWPTDDVVVGPIIRAVATKQADITGSPIIMNAKRTGLARYVHQSFPFRTCFILRSPQHKSIRVNEVLGPLESAVWYLTGTFMIMSSCMMAALFRNENPMYSLERYSNSVILVVGSLCQQSCTIQMDKVPTRIAFLTIMIFSFLLYNYYSAGVVSSRLNDPIHKINDSLTELGKLNTKLSSDYMVYFDLFIKKPDKEIRAFYNTSWSKLKEQDRFMEPDKAVRLVQDGSLAYHAHPETVYPYVDKLFENREICELTEVHLQKKTLSTFAVGKNCSFTEMIKIG
ncbi:uncharacterized protein LOC106657764 [Trichogramma pretiosum]|uniref:uncharacterized protein LOC106657764 n=1 Tax=Trichogramma pretiosum TaxID=7493 RepID=UPI000C71C3E2|nr:uncharacterized protein LOC106657764 [Trichogramma pretiosum]